MTKSTVYLDTSAINFLFADDAPEKKEITVDFFDNFVRLGIYETFVTEYVIAEINQTTEGSAAFWQKTTNLAIFTHFESSHQQH